MQDIDRKYLQELVDSKWDKLKITENVLLVEEANEALTVLAGLLLQGDFVFQVSEYHSDLDCFMEVFEETIEDISKWTVSDIEQHLQELVDQYDTVILEE